MTNKVFQHSLHRELWQWLADNPGKDKDDWPRWERNSGDVPMVFTACFACDVSPSYCNECPLEWPENYSGEYVCDDTGGLWSQWEYAESPQERTRLAIAIKDLPVKDGVVTE